MGAPLVAEHYIKTFDAQMALQSQREGGDLLRLAMRATIAGEQRRFDDVASVTATKVLNHAQPNNYQEMGRNSVWYSPIDFEYSEIFDRQIDPVRLQNRLMSPAFMQSVMNSLWKEVDREIMESLGRNMVTGKTGGGSLALPAAQILADTIGVAAGGSNMNIRKIQTAKELLEGFSWNVRKQRPVLFLDPRMLHHGLYTDVGTVAGPNANRLTAISGDFVSADMQALRTGHTSEFYGCDFVVSNILRGLTRRADTTHMMAYMVMPSACVYGIRDIGASVDRDVTRRGSPFVQGLGTVAASRRLNNGVIEIECDITNDAQGDSTGAGVIAIADPDD